MRWSWVAGAEKPCLVCNQQRYGAASSANLTELLLSISSCAASLVVQNMLYIPKLFAVLEVARQHTSTQVSKTLALGGHLLAVHIFLAKLCSLAASSSFENN